MKYKIQWLIHRWFCWRCNEEGVGVRILGFMDHLIRRTYLYRKLERQLLAAIRSNEATVAENLELTERVSEISRRLCKISVQRAPSPRRTLRICIAIDSSIIEDGLLQGNDTLVIDYIGRDIGMRAAKEILRANFQRWEV